MVIRRVYGPIAGGGLQTLGMWRARLRKGVGAKRRSAPPEFVELPAWESALVVNPSGNDRRLHLELELGGGLVLRIGQRVLRVELAAGAGALCAPECRNETRAELHAIEVR